MPRRRFCNPRLTATTAVAPLLALVLPALAPALHAATVTGSVAQSGGRSVSNAVVWLDGGRMPAPAPLAHAMVDQRDKMFVPHVSVITRGTTVRFPNDDTVFHNVFAYFNAKKFDLGMYPRGASKSVTFDKAGEVVLLCNIHSDMGAYIIVVDSPCYAMSDHSGRFAVKGVAPGSYTLHAWREDGSTATQPVVVTAAGGSAAVTLSRR